MVEDEGRNVDEQELVAEEEKEKEEDQLRENKIKGWIEREKERKFLEGKLLIVIDNTKKIDYSCIIISYFV